jgi:hypothetical protein
MFPIALEHYATDPVSALNITKQWLDELCIRGMKEFLD